MAVIVGNDEVMRQAAERRVAWAGLYQVGLFRNDYIVKRSSQLGDFLPANFSGYIGFQLLTQWSPPSWDGRHAIITGPNCTWTHNGGPIGCPIFGYYVVTITGLYAWAERIEPVVWLQGAGQTYRSQLRYSFSSRF